MTYTRADIIADLQRQLLPLQGYKKPSRETIPVELGIISEAFPYNNFPTGAIHEFITASPSDMAATTGFVMGIVSQLVSTSGVCLWISSSRNLFPPALISFGIEPDKIIFLDLKKETDC
ncbi:MAG TPA: Error-prone repair protein ImuA, partial [Chitinophagaceae bacterium]